MGKVTILSSMGAGLYRVKVEFENARVASSLSLITEELAKMNLELIDLAAQKSTAQADYNADMSALNSYISSTDPEIYTTDPTTLNQLTAATYETRVKYDDVRQKENYAKLRKTSLEKNKDYLQNYCPSDIEIDAWCVAYVEDLTGTTGSIENDYAVKLSKTRQTIDEQTGVWLPEEITIPDSQLQHPLATSQHANWFNLCTAPMAQRHKGRYRIATITSIDYVADTCSLTYEGQFNIYEHDAKLMPALPIIPQVPGTLEQSQTRSDLPIVYLNCNAQAFETNDRVIVDLHNGIGSPAVIGFVSNPRICGAAVCVIDVDSSIGVYPDDNEPPYQPLAGLKLFYSATNTKDLLNYYGGGRRLVDAEGFYSTTWHPGGSWTDGKIAVNWSYRVSSIDDDLSYFIYISGRYGMLSNSPYRHQIFGMCITKTESGYVLNVLSRTAETDFIYEGNYVIRRYTVSKATDGINDDQLNFSLTSTLMIINPLASAPTGFTKNGLSFGMYANDNGLEYFDIYTLNNDYTQYTIFRAYESNSYGTIFAIKADINTFSILKKIVVEGPFYWESATVQAINVSANGASIVNYDLVGTLTQAPDNSFNVNITFFSTELNIYRWIKINTTATETIYQDHLLINNIKQIFDADLSITNRVISYTSNPVEYSTHAASFNDNVLVFGRGHITSTSLIINLKTNEITTLNYEIDGYDGKTFPIGLIHHPY